MSHRSPLLRLLAPALAGGLLLAACGSDSSSDEAAPEAEAGGAASDAPASEAPEEASGGGGDPFVIGMSARLSGPVSLYDTEILAGMNLLVDQINADGGLNGRQVEIVTSDNQSDISLVQPEAERILEQEPDVFVPSCDFDFGAPAARLAEERGILSVSCAGAMLFGKTGVGPLTFNTFPGGTTEGATMAQFMADQGFERPYVLEDTSLEYSKSLCQYFRDAWQEGGGGEFAGQDVFLNSDPSIAAQITNIRSSDADSIATCSYVPGAASMIKQIRDAGIDLPIASGIGLDGNFWVQDTVPGLDDVYVVAIASVFGDDPSDAVNEVVADYTEAVGNPPTTSFALLGHAIVELIQYAVENSDEGADGAALAETIQGMDETEQLLGPTTYTSECHIPVGRPMTVLQVSGGEVSANSSGPVDFLPEAPC